MRRRKLGFLQSMPTCATFLSDTSHLNCFLYTPKHSSWLNQIEGGFSILVRRKLLKRGNFTSVVDLRWCILAFIAYFNKDSGQTVQVDEYKGRPLTV